MSSQSVDAIVPPVDFGGDEGQQPFNKHDDSTADVGLGAHLKLWSQ